MGKWLTKWNVASDSDPEKVYVVSKHEDGDYECTCPAWTRRRTECTHIKDVKMGRVTGGVREPVIDPDELLAVEDVEEEEPDLSEILGGPTKKDRRPLEERIKDDAPWGFE